MFLDLRQTSYLGTTATGGAFGIGQADRRRHLHVIGQTGSGKSTLLENLIVQDVAVGRGVGVIDPHGSLAERALALIPSRRTHELVYLDAASDRPVALNFIGGIPPMKRARGAEDIVASFVHIWGETAVGNRSQQVLRNAVRVLMDAPGGTLFCIPRLLTDRTYRCRLLKAVVDPAVRFFWTVEFEGYDPRKRDDVISPILNKLDALFAIPQLRAILAQPRSTVDLRRIMDEGRILVVNLQKGAIGEGPSHLLGALIVSALSQTALARADTPEEERRPFHLYADEFQNFATASFGIILSEARKYALLLTLSHQFLGQLSDSLRQAVLGNAGSFVSLRVGAEDAPLVARHLGLANPSALQDLSNYQAWGRFLVGNTPGSAIRLDLYPPPPALNRHPERLAANSRIRFGRDLHALERKLARFLNH